MTRIPIYRVSLVRESSVPAMIRQVSSPAEAAKVLRMFIGDVDREHFAVLLLDTRNRAIGMNIVSIGHLNANVVHPREVMKPAILTNAAWLILCHTHPSGDPTPSREDIAITQRLSQVGELLGIPVLDHLILGDQSFISLKQRGCLCPSEETYAHHHP